MNWERVMLRRDLIGGDVEVQVSGRVIRGPIQCISLEANKVAIRRLWTAELIGGTKDQWHLVSDDVTYLPIFSMPQDIGAGRLAVITCDTERVIIFPVNGSKLSRAKVQGLVPSCSDSSPVSTRMV